MDKTKAIWIGSQKGSNIRLCPNLGINWKTENFKLLGVIFSINLTEMVEINYSLKIEESKRLLASWSKRIITPIGKNVVVKTLALAKFNHVIISLPNPSINIVKTIQNMFYKWSSGPDKIKRNIITQKYEKGGLRFINLENFMN